MFYLKGKEGVTDMSLSLVRVSFKGSLSPQIPTLINTLLTWIAGSQLTIIFILE